MENVACPLRCTFLNGILEDDLPLAWVDLTTEYRGFWAHRT